MAFTYAIFVLFFINNIVKCEFFLIGIEKDKNPSIINGNLYFFLISILFRVEVVF